jgi:hypothetical protein
MKSYRFGSLVKFITSTPVPALFGETVHKLFIALSFLAAASSLAYAQPKTQFSCEQIAEKTVRASCIASRQEKPMSKPAEENKSKMDKFIAEAKSRLVERFKDPQSAQFTSMLYVENGVMDSSYLCGMVNSKNSYGGYVGAKYFVVRKRFVPAVPGTDGWEVFINTGEQPDLEVLQMKMATIQCSEGSVSVGT